MTTSIARDEKAVKVCKRCGETKPLDQFPENKHAMGGYEGVCCTCRIPRQKLVSHTEVDGALGKVCSVCQEWKPLTEFGKNKAISDGLNYRCRKCHNEYVRKQWAKDPVGWNERNKAGYHKNADARKETVKAYREANLDRIQEYDRRRNKERYALNPEERNIHAKIRRDRIRAANAAGGEYTAEEWFALKERYHHTCLRCHRQEPDITLTIDHVIPISRGGSNTIDNIQPLCKQCNAWKWTKTIDFRPPS